METSYDKTYDFIYRFHEAQIEPPWAIYDTPTRQCVLVLDAWEIGGDKRDALIVSYPGRITYTVPADRRGNRLYFGAGMKNLLGDGAWGFVIVSTSARTDTVHRRYLNPNYIPDDRRWFDDVVDLSEYDGVEIKVRFAVHPGPIGDTVADWFAWSTPVIKY